MSVNRQSNCISAGRLSASNDKYIFHAAKKAFIFQLLVRKEKGKDGKYLLNIVPFLL